LPIQPIEKVVPGRRTGGDHPSISENPRSHIAGGGKIVMKVTVGTDGRVRAVRITKASDSDLALAAIIAARAWTYTPFLLSGKPVEAEITSEINIKFGH
jgi:outer membrane biosynthesis protein TonB